MRPASKASYPPAAGPVRSVPAGPSETGAAPAGAGEPDGERSRRLRRFAWFFVSIAGSTSR